MRWRHDRHNSGKVVVSARCGGNDFREVVPIMAEAVPVTAQLDSRPVAVSAVAPALDGERG
jgi:hypothetical protein